MQLHTSPLAPSCLFMDWAIPSCIPMTPYNSTRLRVLQRHSGTSLTQGISKPTLPIAQHIPQRSSLFRPASQTTDPDSAGTHRRPGTSKSRGPGRTGASRYICPLRVNRRSHTPGTELPASALTSLPTSTRTGLRPSGLPTPLGHHCPVDHPYFLQPSSCRPVQNVLHNSGYSINGSESQRVDTILTTKLHQPATTILAVFQSAATPVADPAYQRELHDFMVRAQRFAHVTSVTQEAVGNDGRTDLVVIGFHQDKDTVAQYLPDFPKVAANSTIWTCSRLPDW